MNESTELEHLPSFGRWGIMSEWFKEACGIKEKTRPRGEVETISVPGKWHLLIYIPVRAEDDYAGALETGMSLLVAMGTRPEKSYVELGYFVIWLQPAEFYEVKALAKEIRCWLGLREFETTIGDYSPHRRSEGVRVLAHIQFKQDHRRVCTAAKWSLKVMIPPDDRSDGSHATATGLVAHLGLAVEEKDLGRFGLVGGLHLTFDVGDFILAKSRARQAIDWLARKGYHVETSWGDVDLPLHSLDEECVRGLNGTGRLFYDRDNFTCAHVTLEDRNNAESDKEVSLVKRLLARLTGSEEKLTVLLTRGQVSALLDLAGACDIDWDFFSGGIEGDVHDGCYIAEDQWKLYAEVRKIVKPLAKLLEALRIALRHGTTDSRGLLSSAKRPERRFKASKKSKPSTRDFK